MALLPPGDALEQVEDAVEVSGAQPTSALDVQQASVPNGAELKAKRAIMVLLIFQCTTEFLPSEPFLTDFLKSKGFSIRTIVDDIFPLWIDFRFPVLLATGILAEHVGAARTVLFGSLCGTATVAITYFGSSVIAMQISQFTVAISMACHHGPLLALLFELSSKTRVGYQAHVHWTKATLVFSSCIAGVTGSVLLRNLHATYELLWSVSLCAQAISVVVATLLLCNVLALEVERSPGDISRAVKCNCQLWRDWSRCYSFQGVVEWQLWGISMTTVHAMVILYWQSLARSKSHHHDDANGYVSAAGFVLGLLALLGFAKAPFLSNRGNRWWIISSSMLAAGLLVYGMGSADQVWQVYICFTFFQVVFRLSGAVCTQQVGSEIRERVERPPLALQMCISEMMSSISQIVVQSIFKHWHLRGSTRFEALGLGLCCACALFLTLRAAFWLASLGRSRNDRDSLVSLGERA